MRPWPSTWDLGVRVVNIRLQSHPFHALVEGCFLVSIPVGALLSSLRLSVSGHNLTGWSWCVQVALALIVLLQKKKRIHFPIILWLPWLVILTVRCNWLDPTSIQRTLQMIAPIVVGCAASVLLASQGHILGVMNLWFTIILIVVGMEFGLAQIGVVPWEGLVIPAGSMSLCLVGCYFIAPPSRNTVLGCVMWLAAVSACALGGMRVVVAATLMVFPMMIERLGPVRRTAAFCAFLFACAIALVMTDGFRGKVDLSQLCNSQHPLRLEWIHMSGRDRIWPAVWEHTAQSPIIGHGGGSIVSFMSNNIRYGHAGHPHNEFLRVMHDYGCIGLLCLVLPLLWVLHAAAVVSRYGTTSEFRKVGVTAWRGILALFIISMTDNPLTYAAFFMNPLFCIIGWVYASEVTTRRTRYPNIWHKKCQVLTD